MLRVAILGRPNVGKSSLFNRLCKRSLAIVNAQEGTTRDRLYGETVIGDTPVHIIDTGGVDKESEDYFQKHIYKQALAAANEADILLLVVDIHCGITTQDAELARQLLPLKRPLILVANKADTVRDEHLIHNLYKLGISQILPVSATHDKHIDRLLQEIKRVGGIPDPVVVVEDTDEQEEEEDSAAGDNESSALDVQALMDSLDDSQEIQEELLHYELPHEEESLDSTRPLKIALIGRPNVGKSSLINGIINEERCITDNTPGTTRDNIDVSYTFKDRSYVFIDTAGLRKLKSVKNSIEWISTSRTEKAITRADICLLVIDATQGLSSYDKKILSLIAKHKKPHLILVNKWDLMFGVRMEHYVQDLRSTDPYIGQSRILCVSAMKKRNLSKIFAEIHALYDIASQRVPTPAVNKALASALQRHHPQVINNRRLRIYYGIHKTNSPFQFLLFINAKALLTKHYELYLKNTLKTTFNLYGIPFELEYKEKAKRYAAR